MFQNIKVDVIYHNTATDFEMEFNLCGCCRMRLLTDKTPDKKSLVHSLARAVSRSRIIIVVGSLFGEEGTVSVIGEAIKSGTTTIDNNLYGIKSNENVSILRGSTPLITSEGFFGGCIVESGPQTMILLTESKNVRKTILNSLIHPYIEELYAADLNPKAEEEPTEENEIPVIFDEEANTETVEQPDEEENSDETAVELTEALEETEDISLEEVAVEETEEQFTKIEELSLEEETAEEPEEAEDVFVMSNENIYGKEKVEIEEISSGNADYFEDDDYTYVSVSRKGNFNLPILIISIILLVVLAVLCYCIFYVPSTEGVSASQYIKEIYETLFGGSI
jgi:hypothetical protein